MGISGIVLFLLAEGIPGDHNIIRVPHDTTDRASTVTYVRAHIFVDVVVSFDVMSASAL